MTSSHDITRLLREAEEGRPGAMDDLMARVYADLEAVAERHMAEHFGRGLPGVTLEPAALVHESYLRLIQQRTPFQNRGHFFAVATRTILRVLVDYERKRRAAKRGGGRRPLTLALDGGARAPDTAAGPGIEVGTLVEALERLEGLDPRKADVVRLRVVGGLEMREIGESLGISLATVERDWVFAKAWLAREAAAARDEPSPPG